MSGCRCLTFIVKAVDGGGEVEDDRSGSSAEYVIVKVEESIFAFVDDALGRSLDLVQIVEYPRRSLACHTGTASA